MYLFAYISEGDKGIIGSVVGAFLAGIFSFLAALFAAWLAIRHENNKQKKEDLRAYNRNVISMELSCQQHLVQMLVNQRLLDNCATVDKPGNFTMTLPRINQLAEVQLDKVRNDQLISEYETLRMRAQQANRLIEDFNEYYKNTRSNVYSALLDLEKEKQLNKQLVIQDHDTLKLFAVDVNKSVDRQIEQAKKTLVIIRCHGHKGRKKETAFKSIKELDSFKVNKRKINAEIKVLNKEFNQEMFDSLNSGESV